MNAKFVLTLVIALSAFMCVIEARSISKSAQKKGRILPGAIAVKKLVLLKFKKIIPISMVLLKSDKDNEAELVPVYPSNEMPANVQFIPTPNGISGDKEVQAIAIPTELHQQLESHGLADLEHIQALLSQTEEEKEDTMPAEELLNIKEDDDKQILPELSTEKKNTMPAMSAVRRIAADDISKPNLRTSVEEIPLFLYSSKDDEYRQLRRYYPGRRHHA